MPQRFVSMLWWQGWYVLLYGIINKADVTSDSCFETDLERARKLVGKYDKEVLMSSLKICILCSCSISPGKIAQSDTTAKWSLIDKKCYCIKVSSKLYSKKFGPCMYDKLWLVRIGFKFLCGINPRTNSQNDLICEMIADRYNSHPF